MILVSGATGLLGSEVCRVLSSTGEDVRALVRTTSDPTKVAELEGFGVEIAVGDLRQRATLDSVCQGARCVVSTASAILSGQEGDSIQTVDLEGHINLIDAAKAAGVDHFVLISFPPIDIDFPLQTAKRAVEQHLKNSGLAYTILQPTNFMEVWLSPALGFDAANAKAQIYGSGENEISWISYTDVAKFVAASLNNPQARNAVIALGGPEALSLLEVVKIFEKLTGRAFDVQHVSAEMLERQMAAADGAGQQSFAALMLGCSRGSVVDMRETLQKFPIQLKSVAGFAQAATANDGV